MSYDLLLDFTRTALHRFVDSTSRDPAAKLKKALAMNAPQIAKKPVLVEQEQPIKGTTAELANKIELNTAEMEQLKQKSALDIKMHDIYQKLKIEYLQGKKNEAAQNLEVIELEDVSDDGLEASSVAPGSDAVPRLDGSHVGEQEDSLFVVQSADAAEQRDPAALAKFTETVKALLHKQNIPLSGSEEIPAVALYKRLENLYTPGQTLTPKALKQLKKITGSEKEAGLIELVGGMVALSQKEGSSKKPAEKQFFQFLADHFKGQASLEKATASALAAASNVARQTVHKKQALKDSWCTAMIKIIQTPKYLGSELQDDASQSSVSMRTSSEISDVVMMRESLEALQNLFIEIEETKPKVEAQELLVSKALEVDPALLGKIKALEQENAFLLESLTTQKRNAEIRENNQQKRGSKPVLKGGFTWEDLLLSDISSFRDQLAVLCNEVEDLTVLKNLCAYWSAHQMEIWLKGGGHKVDRETFSREYGRHLEYLDGLNEQVLLARKTGAPGELQQLTSRLRLLKTKYLDFIHNPIVEALKLQNLALVNLQLEAPAGDKSIMAQNTWKLLTQNLLGYLLLNLNDQAETFTRNEGLMEQSVRIAQESTFLFYRATVNGLRKVAGQAPAPEATKLTVSDGKRKLVCILLKDWHEAFHNPKGEWDINWAAFKTRYDARLSSASAAGDSAYDGLRQLRAMVGEFAHLTISTPRIPWGDRLELAVRRFIQQAHQQRHLTGCPTSAMYKWEAYYEGYFDTTAQEGSSRIRSTSYS